MPFSQRQTLLLIFFPSSLFLLYSSSSVDVHMFLDLFYSPLFACRFSWLLFSSISQNDHPGSATLWQLRVHYFCHNWKRKCCLHFIVNYSWKRRSVWLCLHCWTRSLPYSWAEYGWIFLDQISTPIQSFEARVSRNPMIYNSAREIEGLPKNTCNVLCVHMYVSLSVALWD